MATIIKSDSGTYSVKEGDKVTPIVAIVDGGKTLKLPANESNRQYFSIATFAKLAKDNQLELTHKETITITRKDGAPRQVKPLEDWLEGKDKEAYLALVAKAKAARDAANTKPVMTEAEKAKRKVERAQEALAKVLKAEQPAPTPVADIAATNTEPVAPKTVKKSKKA